MIVYFSSNKQYPIEITKIRIEAHCVKGRRGKTVIVKTTLMKKKDGTTLLMPLAWLPYNRFIQNKAREFNPCLVLGESVQTRWIDV